MSYGFYVYTDRASIATTKVYSQTAGATYTYNYGTGQHSLNGFTDGHYLTFEAFPADGYEFKRWAYHIGSPTATTKYSTSNPFKYYGSEGNDIYIAAEGQAISSGGGDSGGDTDGSWAITTLAAITDNDRKLLTLDANICYCYPITFTYSGIATFYSVNRLSLYVLDLVAYLSTSPPSSFDYDNGKPSSYVYYNDDTNESYDDNQIFSDFGFQYYVTSNEQYYLYVRHRINNDTTNGAAYINIVAPTEAESDYFEWSSAVAQGLPVKNVSHTEWDNFIDKIIEVLTDKGMLNQPLTSEVYGYLTGTTYRTMLNDCYLTYNSDLEGYPLTAKKFNVARFIIGSHVSTNLDEPEKISKTSKVLAEDFIKLENCLKAWQG